MPSTKIKVITWINVVFMSLITLYILFLSTIASTKIHYLDYFYWIQFLIALTVVSIVHACLAIALVIMAPGSERGNGYKNSLIFANLNASSSILVFALALIQNQVNSDEFYILMLKINYIVSWPVIILNIITILIFVIPFIKLSKKKKLDSNDPQVLLDSIIKNPPSWNNNKSDYVGQNISSEDEEELDNKLEKLIDKFNKGKLTKDEFERQKSKLLSKY